MNKKVHWWVIVAVCLTAAGTLALMFELLRDRRDQALLEEVEWANPVTGEPMER